MVWAGQQDYLFPALSDLQSMRNKSFADDFKISWAILNDHE